MKVNGQTHERWKTHPVARMSEMPMQVDVAIFDATGKRIRQAPFTPARILAAL
jgi:hypothetical protein